MKKRKAGMNQTHCGLVIVFQVWMFKPWKTHPCSFPQRSNYVPLGGLPQCSLEICTLKECIIKCSRLPDAHSRKQFWPSEYTEVVSPSTIALPTHTYIKPYSPYTQTYSQKMHTDRQVCIKLP